MILTLSGLRTIFDTVRTEGVGVDSTPSILLKTGQWNTLYAHMLHYFVVEKISEGARPEKGLQIFRTKIFSLEYFSKISSKINFLPFFDNQHLILNMVLGMVPGVPMVCQKILLIKEKKSKYFCTGLPKSAVRRGKFFFFK